MRPIGSKHQISTRKAEKGIIPMLERRLTPTLWACTEPAMVTHGTPMYKDSHVVVVPAYGKVSKLYHKKIEKTETERKKLIRYITLACCN